MNRWVCWWVVGGLVWGLLLPLAHAQYLEEQGRVIRKPLIDDDSHFTNIGKIGLTITNFGTFGDGFVIQRPVDQPSCEYPLGSGIEHMFDGGLWVGAVRSDGTIQVTTGAVDIPSLRDVAAGFEFTNSDDPSDVIIERSSLADSPFYDPNAISHQDFVCDFTDSNMYVPGTNIRIPWHRPLNISVHLETYAWSYPFADAFVIFNYTIKNTGRDTLWDLYVGLWADLVVRNTKITPPRIGAPFYQHVGNGYVDSLYMAYAYDYDGDPGFTDSYVALKLLGVTPQANDRMYTFGTHYNMWQFRNTSDPVFFSPQNDVECYEKMKGLSPSVYESKLRTPGNWMTLITTGPFERLDPDSSINVVFAIICAKKYGTDPTPLDTEISRKNLYENARWAQRAYNGEDRNGNGVLDLLDEDVNGNGILDPGEDINGNGILDFSEDINGNGKLDRFVLPTPPSPPKVKAIPGDGMVTLYWDNSAEKSRDLITGERDFEGYRIYRTRLGEDLPGRDLLSSFHLIAEFDSIDGIGYDTGFDYIRLPKPIYFEDEITYNEATGTYDTLFYYYKFVNTNLHNGWQYAYAVTAFDRGNPEEKLYSLESSQRRSLVYVFPGKPPSEDLPVRVYPNPYRAYAAWDGTLERQRKIYFYNLPPLCEVRIYTLAGDLVDSFIHDSQRYQGTDIRWFQDFSSEKALFAGGEHAWDLVTKDDQAIASGLYLFTVKDLRTGKIKRGKFLVIK